MKINTNVAEGWQTKGVILQQLGKKQEAEECYEKARNLGYFNESSSW